MMTALGPQCRNAQRLWVNWIGLEAQGEMRKTIAQRFHLRGTEDGFKQAVVFKAAQVSRIDSGTAQVSADLHVGGPGFGQSRTQKLGRILARHEDAQTRTENSQVYYNGKGQAMTGLGFFLPAKGMRTNSTNPARKLYPSAIGSAMRRTPSGVTLAKGTKKGSKKTGSGVSYFATRKGIFMRKHTLFGGRVQVEALWWFNSKVRTSARLELWDTALRVFDAKALPLGLQAIDEAIWRASR